MILKQCLRLDIKDSQTELAKQQLLYIQLKNSYLLFTVSIFFSILCVFVRRQVK